MWRQTRKQTWWVLRTSAPKNRAREVQDLHVQNLSFGHASPDRPRKCGGSCSWNWSDTLFQSVLCGTGSEATGAVFEEARHSALYRSNLQPIHYPYSRKRRQSVACFLRCLWCFTHYLHSFISLGRWLRAHCKQKGHKVMSPCYMCLKKPVSKIGAS